MLRVLGPDTTDRRVGQVLLRWLAALAADEAISDEALVEALDDDGDEPLTQVIHVRSDRN